MREDIARLQAVDPAFERRSFILFAGAEGPTTLTYGDVGRQASAYERELSERRIERGDRVAVLADSHPDVIAALVGHHRSGVIHVPINTRYRAQEVRHILTDAGPELLLVDEAHAELARVAAPNLPTRRIGTPNTWRPDTVEGSIDRPALADDDPALMIYTSGTTGPSKGVVHSFRSVAGNMRALTESWGWSSADQLVLALPLFHVHGLCIGIHGSLLHGMTVRLISAFNPGTVVHGIAEGGTVFMGVPTMYRRLLAHFDDFPDAAAVLRGARLFTAGSAALAPADFLRFEVLTGHRIVERYGMSETLITLANTVDRPCEPGLVGRPVSGVEARIVDENGAPLAVDEVGDLEVRGVGLMTEYWRRPEETQASFRDGWFRTGDVARQRPSGDYRIEGRRSVDIIKAGGFKISAREIEDVLRAHPGVADAAVVGVPDADWGERIHAFVVPSKAPPDPAALERELIDWAAASLASYKKPRAVRFMNELPKNALGKIQKHVLKTSGTS